MRSLARNPSYRRSSTAGLAVAGLLLGIALGTSGSGDNPQPKPRAPVVQPIGHGTTPQQQARN